MTTDENTKFERDLEFIAIHFKKGAFNKHLCFKEGKIDFITARRKFISPNLKKWGVAASVACALSASAIIGYHLTHSSEPSVSIGKTEITQEKGSTKKVVHLQFDNATLEEVSKGVEEAYGVKLSNLPREEIRLTLSYEGNAYDFVDTVNELLGTEIIIKE